ncbi:hypothetical protein MIMGU_mgv1a024907mg, partial [Erythranthe guttata]
MAMTTIRAQPNGLFSVPFYNENIYVTVTKEAERVHEWICSIYNIHNDFPKNLLVGLDTEWLPNMSPREDHPIAILQLCVGNRCLVFQILHADFIPPLLHAFLIDPRHTFCGVGIKDDVDKLYSHHGLRVGRTSDLNDLARLAMTNGRDNEDGRLAMINRRLDMIHGRNGNGEYKYMGLKKMAYVVLGKNMEKPLQITLSKWDAKELDCNQIEYAAIDAVVSYQIAFALCLLIFRPITPL